MPLAISAASSAGGGVVDTTSGRTGGTASSPARAPLGASDGSGAADADAPPLP